MSLKETFPAQIPAETARFVEPLLSEGSIYRFIGQEIDQVFSDDDFAAMYADKGRPGVNLMTLALVTVFRFVEKLPDRAAAQMAVMRPDWKHALRQSLDWTGFHYSDLCSFRKRLLEHESERGVFERIVTYLRENGYVQTAATFWGAVRDLGTVGLVRETLQVTVCAHQGGCALDGTVSARQFRRDHRFHHSCFSTESISPALQFRADPHAAVVVDANRAFT